MRRSSFRLLASTSVDLRALVGAGLYVDNEVGSCGSTGRGEANVQNVCSFAAVELMRHGASPAEAGLAVLHRVVRNTREEHLLGRDGKPNFGLKFYLLHASGEHAGVSLWSPTKFAVTEKIGALGMDRTVAQRPAI